MRAVSGASRMPIVHANGIDIHYRITGDGPETALLVNGVGDDLEGWAMQVGPLVAAGLRLVTFDNRGVGDRRPPDRTRAGTWRPIPRRWSTRLGLAEFHLVGVSMGGLIAQEYALRTLPVCVRSCSPTRTPSRTPTPAPHSTCGDASPKRGGMPLMMRQQAPWVFSPAFYSAHPDRLATILGDMERTSQPAASFSAQIAALLTHDCSDRIGSLQTPALVIAADDDIIIRLSLSHRLYEELPQGSWAIVPGGHAAFVENPGPWNRAVVAFIDQHRAAVR